MSASSPPQWTAKVGEYLFPPVQSADTVGNTFRHAALAEIAVIKLLKTINIWFSVYHILPQYVAAFAN